MRTVLRWSNLVGGAHCDRACKCQVKPPFQNMNLSFYIFIHSFSAALSCWGSRGVEPIPASWGEGGVHPGHVATRGEHANSAQKPLARDSNQGPSGCEATAITTAPPCHLFKYAQRFLICPRWCYMNC